MPSPQRITVLLEAVSRGDKSAEAELLPIVYQQLRQIASHYMRLEAQGHTLQTTDLVHEAYLRLVRPSKLDWQNRTHFFAVAASVMRRVLVDHARAKKSEKRGGKTPVTVDSIDVAAPAIDDVEQILALDAALARLAVLAARQSRIVELRYFAGMTVEETATALDLSPRTVKREWQLAKAWLYGELHPL